MTHRKLSIYLKLIILAIALFGFLVYAMVLPDLGQGIVRANPEFAYCYAPWLAFLCLSGLPCYAALILAWRIAVNIGRDRSFILENARLLKWIFRLAAGDAVFFLLGNVVYLFLNMNHPGIVLYSLLVVFCGVAVYVVAAGLSHLTEKAALLQEQSDLTI